MMAKSDRPGVDEPLVSYEMGAGRILYLRSLITLLQYLFVAGYICGVKRHQYYLLSMNLVR